MDEADFFRTGSLDDLSQRREQAPRIAYMRLANPNPKGPSRHQGDNLGKLFTQSKDSIAYFEPFQARIVFSKQGRERKAVGGGPALCASFNRFTPAPKIAEPFCEETPAAKVGKLLEKYGMDKAKIPGLLKVVTDAGVLKKCAVRGDGGKVLPLCRCAIKGPDKSCKENYLLYVWNVETNQMFKVVLSGGSLYGTKENPAPFMAFQDFLYHNGCKASEVVFKLASVADGQYFRFDFRDMAVDPVPNEQLAFWAGSAEADFKKMSEWVPPELRAKREEPEQAVDSDLEEEDEIPF